MKKVLTDKQEAFCLEYLKDLNATQAAIRAGYSERSARRTGSENLAKPEIAARIEQAKAARTKRTKIDADWLLLRLAEEAQADLADLYNEDGTLKPIRDWPKIWRTGLVSGVVTRTIGRGDDAEPVVEVKLSDRVKRLELIGKHIDVGAFKEALSLKDVPAPTIIINRPGGN